MMGLQLEHRVLLCTALCYIQFLRELSLLIKMNVSWCACSKQDKNLRICDKVPSNRFHCSQEENKQKIYA